MQPKTPLFTCNSQHPPRSGHAVYLGVGDLIGFVYDLSDTEDVWTYGIYGIYILWQISSPCNKDSGERSVVLFFTSEALIKFALIIKTKNT